MNQFDLAKNPTLYVTLKRTTLTNDEAPDLGAAEQLVCQFLYAKRPSDFTEEQIVSQAIEALAVTSPAFQDRVAEEIRKAIVILVDDGIVFRSVPAGLCRLTAAWMMYLMDTPVASNTIEESVQPTEEERIHAEEFKRLSPLFKLEIQAKGHAIPFTELREFFWNAPNFINHDLDLQEIEVGSTKLNRQEARVLLRMLQEEDFH